MKFRCLALLFCFLPVAAFAGKHAPLPPTLMEAKTVYIDNQSGNAAFADRCYDELRRWGRFKIVPDPKGADIIFRISTATHSTGARASSTTTIEVLEASTGQVLWSDSRPWGNLYTGFRSATRAVVKELKKRVQEQESAPAAYNTSPTIPKSDANRFAQAGVGQSEPDCGATTEEDARREGIAWASKHPEYHPTPENAQKVVGYMESHGLCPTQQNFDTAYNAVRSQQDAQSGTGAIKTEPQLTVLMLDDRNGTFNHRFAAECPELGMAFPFERGQPESQWAVALVSEPSPAWILFREPSSGMHVVLAPENDVDSAVRRACNLVKKPETATWVPN
jgi:hypothetical protein